MFITYGFIYRIKSFFSEIELNVDKQVTEDQIYEHLFHVLSLVKSIDDMRYLFMEYQFSIKKITKINRMLRIPRKREMFDQTKFKEKDLINKFNETTNIVISNILNKKNSQYTIYNPFVEKQEQFYDIQKKHRKFSLFSDSLFVGISKEEQFIIKDLNGNLIIKLKLKINTENDFLFMNHNKNSNYEIRNDEGFIDLYDLSLNTEESVTTISSDIFTEKKYDRGIQVIWMDEEADYELSLLIAIGIAELTYNHFRKSKRERQMMTYMMMKSR